jgi:uncharacterized protein involved in outer membrane biogenesis
MKKKILLGLAIGVVVVLVGAVIIAGFFLGNIVKAGMETVGPKVTQTAFTVDRVHISPLSGSVGLDNFVLGNPDEYKAKTPNAITVGKVAVSVAPMSVVSDKIIVKNIEVREPEITFVGNPLGANNLKKILDNVNTFTAGSGGQPADTNAPAPPAEKPPGKKLQVDNFLITGAKVHFNGATLLLPDIRLANLGTGPDGITPAGLLKDALSEINLATLKVVGESATKLGKDAANAAKDAGKTIGEEANKIGKSIGDLFKK